MSTPNNTTTCCESFSTLVAATGLTFIGIPPNLLTFALVLRAKHPKSTTTLLLLNLALADIVNLLTVLLVAVLLNTGRNFSKEAIRDNIKTLSVPPKAISNITLAIIALKRYIGLVKTMKPSLCSEAEVIKRLVAGIWLISIAIQVPGFVYRMLSEGGSDEFINTYNIACIIVTYFLPLMVVAYCYGNILRGLCHDGTILGQNPVDVTALHEKQRFIRIMVALSVVFMVFNLPSVTMKILKTAAVKFGDYDLFCIVLLLGCVSSVVNPYLYGLHSKERRQQMKRLFCHQENPQETTV